MAVGYSNVFARGGDVAALPGGLPLVSQPWGCLLTAQSHKRHIGDIDHPLPETD